jgi:hypothetical protein
LPRDWGKKVVTILPYLIGANLKRGLGHAASELGGLKIGGQFRSITATFAIMAPRHGILIEKRGTCH